MVDEDVLRSIQYDMVLRMEVPSGCHHYSIARASIVVCFLFGV